MRTLSKIGILSVTILLIGCGDEDIKEDKTSQQESTIKINKMEKVITNKDSNIGCKVANAKDKECSQKRDISSIDMILSSLNREKHNKIKDGLKNLVEDDSQNSREVIKKDISRLVETSNIEPVDEEDKKISTPPALSKDVKIIKESLEKLIESSDNRPKAIKIKNKIDEFVEKVVDKNHIQKTKKTLANLVKKIETSKDSNLKNMTEALIDDIARSKVDIIDETDDYFIIKVKKGDTLSHLAKRYYKDSSKFKIIYEANIDKISPEYEIYPNTKLKIPKI